MLGNNLNEFIDDMYHNPEKEIVIVEKGIWLLAMLTKLANYTH